jgi:hypothetical protein
MTTLEFDKVSHKYMYNGQRVPSVTQVLSSVGLIDLSMVPADILHEACEFGGIVHLATELFDQGRLDFNSINSEVLRCVRAWERFLIDCDVQILEIEKRVYSNRYKFAGTLDRIAVIKGKLWILDIKTGTKQKAYEVQTGGYSISYKEMTGIRAIKRMSVYLDGEKYKIDEHKKLEDESVFLSALAVHNYKRR